MVVQIMEVKESKSHIFVDFVLDRINANDTAILSCLKRAESKNTAFYAYDILYKFTKSFDDKDFYPYSIVAASMSRSKITKDGDFPLFTVLRKAYSGNDKKALTSNNEEDIPEQARAKLKRALACNDIVELCNVIKALLKYIEGKDQIKYLSYKTLLSQLCFFSKNDVLKEKIKQQFVIDFYRLQNEDNNEAESDE